MDWSELKTAGRCLSIIFFSIAGSVIYIIYSQKAICITTRAGPCESLCQSTTVFIETTGTVLSSQISQSYLIKYYTSVDVLSGVSN